MQIADKSDKIFRQCVSHMVHFDTNQLAWNG